MIGITKIKLSIFMKSVLFRLITSILFKNVRLTGKYSSVNICVYSTKLFLTKKKFKSGILDCKKY